MLPDFMKESQPGMELGKAIKSAVDYCVKNDVIKNFLLKHKRKSIVIN